eukprot:TRINITY_DN61404_c0_g1_i1.p2 TRINITY_DN61404_c0_g1~~TRINITY_DN61404_c0_g1_i1.p2  ORF type:complete len:127 (+),score=33.75 TRINITY_DN61404_c0_g1_i1:109-489(+)
MCIRDRKKLVLAFGVKLDDSGHDPLCQSACVCNSGRQHNLVPNRWLPILIRHEPSSEPAAGSTTSPLQQHQWQERAWPQQEVRCQHSVRVDAPVLLSLIHISEPTRLLSISYAVFCLKKKKKTKVR